MCGFDPEVFFTFAYFRTTTSLFTNALSVTHTKRCTWETCFYTFASFAAALFAATMDWLFTADSRCWYGCPPATLVAYAPLCRESSPNLWGQEGQGLKLLPAPTRILLDKWPASRAV